MTTPPEGAVASASTANPGIERGMTAVPQHWVESHLSIGMKWADAEALFITIDALVRAHGGGYQSGIAPSHVEAVTALRDLLAERIYVIREVVARPSRVADSAQTRPDEATQ